MAMLVITRGYSGLFFFHGFSQGFTPKLPKSFATIYVGTSSQRPVLPASEARVHWVENGSFGT